MKWPQLFWILVFFVNACPSSAPIRRDPVSLDGVDVREIIRRNNAHANHMQSMRGVATLTLESPKSSNQFSAQIAVKYPDSVYVKIEGILGIDGLKASLNRETFVVYNIINRYVVRGRTSSAAIRNTFDYDVTFEEMVELLTGTVFLEANMLGSNPQLSTDSSYYVLTVGRGEGTRKIWVDPYADYAVAKIHDLDSAQRLVLEREFTRFEKIDGHMMPRYVRVYRPRENDFLSLYFNARQINRTIKSTLFLVRYPQNIDIIEQK